MRGQRAARMGVVAVAVGLGLTVARPRLGGAAPEGPSTTAPSTPSTASTPTSEPSTPGRFYYLRDCAVCHAADATGTNRGPSLQRAGRAAVDFWVSTGRMPLVSTPARSPTDRVLAPDPVDQLGDPSAPTLRHTPAYSPSVIAELVDYVASIAPGGPDVPSLSVAGADVAAGGEVYRLECAACHSWAATGGALYQREAPSLSRATVTQIAEAVRTGPGQMPSFGPSAITDAQLAEVTAYVRYLDHPDDRGGTPLWHLGPVAEGGVAILGGMGMMLLTIRWIGERS